MVIPRAIVVDDDSDITQVFSELLESVNLKIVGIGHTGIDAIRLVKSQKPDIVFLDIHMPELNGVEALKEIKRISSKTHIVIITGDKSVDPKKLSHYGATGTIFKPFDMDQIMGVFEKIKTEEYTLVKK